MCNKNQMNSNNLSQFSGIVFCAILVGQLKFVVSENFLNGDSPKAHYSKVDCFFKSSTRITEIPTQVICQCLQNDSSTSKLLQNRSTGDLRSSNEKFGKFKNDSQTDSHQQNVDYHDGVLNVKRDIFDVFDWDLLQHMSNIVVNGGDCKKLIVTFDVDLFYQGTKTNFGLDHPEKDNISSVKDAPPIYNQDQNETSKNIETIEVESINKVNTPRGVNVTIKDVPELELFLPRDILDETPKKFFFIRKLTVQNVSKMETIFVTPDDDEIITENYQNVITIDNWIENEDMEAYDNWVENENMKGYFYLAITLAAILVVCLVTFVAVICCLLKSPSRRRHRAMRGSCYETENETQTIAEYMTASKKDRNDKVKRASSWRYESTHYIQPKNRSRLPNYGESHKQYDDSNQGNELTDISPNFGVHHETLLNSSNIQNINNSTVGGSSQSRNQDSYRLFNHEYDDSVREYANVFQSEKMPCRRKESMHKRQSSNFSIVQLAENTAKIPMQISMPYNKKNKNQATDSIRGIYPSPYSNRKSIQNEVALSSFSSAQSNIKGNIQNSIRKSSGLYDNEAKKQVYKFLIPNSVDDLDAESNDSSSESSIQVNLQDKEKSCEHGGINGTDKDH